MKKKYTSEEVVIILNNAFDKFLKERKEVDNYKENDDFDLLLSMIKMAVLSEAFGILKGEK